MLKQDTLNIVGKPLLAGGAGVAGAIALKYVMNVKIGNPVVELTQKELSMLIANPNIKIDPNLIKDDGSCGIKCLAYAFGALALPVGLVEVSKYMKYIPHVELYSKIAVPIVGGALYTLAVGNLRGNLKDNILPLATIFAVGAGIEAGVELVGDKIVQELGLLI